MYIEHGAAVVSGAAALALSEVLRRPETRAALLALPPWLIDREFADAVASLHVAGAAYRDQLRRNETQPSETARRSTRAGSGVGAERPWSSSRAAWFLQLSVRRTQQLAAAGRLGAELVDGQWQIDPVSVRRFAQVREGAA
jgi:hypothetical protein